MHGPAIMSYLLFFFVMPPTYFRLLPLSLTEHDQCPACCLPYYSELFQPSLPDNLLVLTGEIHTSLQNWHRATGILCSAIARWVNQASSNHLLQSFGSFSVQQLLLYANFFVLPRCFLQLSEWEGTLLHACARYGKL